MGNELIRDILIICIILVFGVSGYFNIKWIIREYGRRNVFLWIKVYNAVISILWVVAYSYVLIGFVGLNSEYDHTYFSATILRPLNLLTGGAFAVGAIARLRISEYIRRM